MLHCTHSDIMRAWKSIIAHITAQKGASKSTWVLSCVIYDLGGTKFPPTKIL